MENALIEAAYLTNVERNADVVVMSSYAPLLAKKEHTSWNPDLIYFDNTSVSPTFNYYVQRAFGQNAGDEYIYSTLQVNGGQEIEQRIDKSVVRDSLTGDLIIKLVSLLPKASSMTINLGADEEQLKVYDHNADIITMTKEDASWDVAPRKQLIDSNTSIQLPAYSFTVIRLKQSNKK